MRQKTGWRTWAGVICMALMTALMVACPQEYDFERKVPERVTFGEEVVKVVRKDATISARAARERTAALDRDRDQLVLAIDTIVPQDWLWPLERVLRLSQPNVDVGILPEATRRIAEVLGDCAADTEVRQVWAEDERGARDHLRAPELRAPLGERMVAFPELKRLTRWLMLLLLDHDGLTEEGQPQSEEPTYVLDLMRLLADEMLMAEVTEDANATKFQLLDL
ncbi:MAG: hypothetical protein AAFX99_26915, partial [Myxococcota bacterium]